MTDRKQSVTRYGPGILEEELKNKVGKDFFGDFDYLKMNLKTV